MLTDGDPFAPPDEIRPRVDEALVLTIALHFVPTLFGQIDKITEAQRARGADDLPTARESRAFRGARHRTRLHQLRLTWEDLVASLIVLVAVLSIFALSRGT
ncbi:MAG: hypothetical protein R6X31_07890 [Anaerolineae bacterium]